MAERESNDEHRMQEPEALREEREGSSISVASPEVQTDQRSEVKEGIAAGEARVEQGGLNVAQIGKFAAVSIIVLAVLITLLLQVIRLQQYNEQMETAMQADFPQQQQLVQQAQEQLSSYGVVSEEENIYHVPIDQAMEYVAGEY